MADRYDVHVLIGSKHNKWAHNSSDDSWYAENFTQDGSSEDRASFHYPNLERWLLLSAQRYEQGKSKYNPFEGENHAFIFHDKETKGIANVTISPNVIEYARKVFKTDMNFVVHMFDWDLEVLTQEQLKNIFNGIHASFVSHSFSDPLGISTNVDLVAKTKEPKTTKKGKKPIKEGKASERCIIKLNERQLYTIIAESVKRVLSEKSGVFLIQ